MFPPAGCADKEKHTLEIDVTRAQDPEPVRGSTISDASLTASDAAEDGHSNRPASLVSLLGTVALVLGGAGLCVLAALAPLMDRQGGKLVMSIPDTPSAPGESGKWVAVTIPNELAAASLATAALGCLVGLACVVLNPRLRAVVAWTCEQALRHRLAAAVIILVALLGSVDIYELTYEHYRTRKVALRPWMVREDMVSWLLFAATVLIGLALWRRWSAGASSTPRGLAHPPNLSRRAQLRWWLVALSVPIILAAAMSRWALDGLPHFSDAVTYLLQGRLLMTGRLTQPTPLHPDLFEASIFFLHDGPRFFGKYPPAWPVILGVFDALNAAFLANACLTGLTALLTGFLARQFLPARQSLIAALIMAASPWLWFSGADMASHVATTCGVTASLAFGLRALRTGSCCSAIGAGLALAVAMLVRPVDAALFALLPGVVAAVLLARQPKRFIIPIVSMGVAASLGVAMFMLVNLATTGHPLRTSYSMENRLASDMRFTPLSMLARFFFQCAELQQRFPGSGIGGLTVATLGAVIAWHRRRTWDLWLVVGTSAVFFLVLTGWGFENVWWGPRWLLPVTPAIAILMSEVIDLAYEFASPGGRRLADHSIDDAAAHDPRRTHAARLCLCLALAACLTGLGRYAGQFWLHRITPPHNVSAQVHQRVESMGLRHAVVALPPAGARAPFDARSGLAFMHFPIESNDVIYIRAIPNWQRKAGESFPDRSLHELRRDPRAPQGFEIDRIDGSD